MLPHAAFALVRHGQTEWNLHKRIQGSTDIPLNATGRAEAVSTGLSLLTRSELPARRWDLIVASPLLRAAETARIIADELGLTAPVALDALTERHHGAIEGLSFAERQQRFPDGVAVPGLEPRQSVLDRVLPALAHLAAQHPGRRILVVTHGGVIGTVIRHLTDDQRPSHNELIRNGSVHDFTWHDGRLRLEHFDSSPREPGEPGHTRG
ncbi:MAG: histidine phosphatase family protein [Cryobacterium sp.]